MEKLLSFMLLIPIWAGTLSARADDLFLEWIKEYQTKKEPEQKLFTRLKKIEIIKENLAQLSDKREASYNALALSENYLDFDNQKSLEYAKAAAVDADDELKIIAGIQEVRALLALGDFSQGLEKTRTLEKKHPTKDQERQLAFLRLKALFMKEEYATITKQSERLSKDLLRYPFMEESLKILAASAEKAGDRKKMYRYLERLAQDYPLTEASVSAFTRLKEANKIHDTKASPYHFSASLLYRLAWHANLDTSLKEFLFAAKDKKISGIRRNPIEFTRLEKLEYLYRVRLFKEAQEYGTKLLTAETALSNNEKNQVLLWLGRSCDRLGKDIEAIHHFSTLVSRLKDQGRQAYEYLADSLSYAGLELSAASIYGRLASTSNQELIRWHHFWTTYSAKDFASAFELIKKNRTYVPARDSNLPEGRSYWMAKLYQKQQENTEAQKIFANILASSADNIYSHFIVDDEINHDWLIKLTPQPAIETKKKPEVFLKENAKELPSALKNLRTSVSFLQGLGLKKDTDIVLAKLDNFEAKYSPIALNIAKTGEDYYRVSELARVLLVDQMPPKTNWFSIKESQQKMRELWMDYYPQAFGPLVEEICQTLDLDPLLVYSVMRSESSYKEDAISYVGARGLMQIMPYTGYQIAKNIGLQKFNIDDLFDPGLNIAFSAWYLKKLLTHYKGSKALAIAAYNAGPTAVDRWVKRCKSCALDEFVETVSYKETRRYIKETLKHYGRYLSIYKDSVLAGELDDIPTDIEVDNTLF